MPVTVSVLLALSKGRWADIGWIWKFCPEFYSEPAGKRLLQTAAAQGVLCPSVLVPPVPVGLFGWGLDVNNAQKPEPEALLEILSEYIFLSKASWYVLLLFFSQED